MNLNRLRFWKNPTATDKTPSPADDKGNQTPGSAAQSSATVVPLRRDDPKPSDEDHVPDADTAAPPHGMETTERLATPVVRFRGLLNLPELERFFEDNYFAYGHHAGIRFRSAEALSLGLDAITAKFQNTLVDLVERRRTKLNRIQSEIISAEALNPTMTARLRLGAEQLEAEMALLDEQIRLAADRKGWVLDAVNRYRLGFDRGMHKALEFELLNG